MDRGAWRPKFQSHKESDIIEATQQAGRKLGSITYKARSKDLGQFIHLGLFN